jgi:uroporphyrinogen decarboxylase
VKKTGGGTTMNKIIPRERVRAAFNFEETDIVPYDLAIESEVQERLSEHFGGDEWEHSIEKHFTHVIFPFEMDFISEDCFRDEYGCIWDVRALPMHLVESPLKEPSLKGYDFDGVRRKILDMFSEDTARLIIDENQDKFILGYVGSSLFETSWKLRGFENALVDCVLHQSFYEELLDRIMEVQLSLIDRICEFPVDAVFLGDDWGDQRGIIIGPERWRRFLKPRFRRLFDRVHQHGKIVIMHCCGNAFEVIPDVIEIGLDALESLQPEAMNIYEIKRRYGRNIRLWGGLGTQQLLPFGTPEDIRNEIHHLIAEMGAGGGYILASAKPLMKEVPTENAIAVIEEFSTQHGRTAS